MLIRTLLALVLLGVFSEGVKAQATRTISSDINVFTTLYKDTVYTLSGTINVNAPTGFLLIQEGTIIKGEKATNGTLIMNPGTQILANGFSDLPIIFTSDQPEGSRSPGDWGGLIIKGDAPINDPSGTATLSGGLGTYGGTNAFSTNGSMQHIRIEYAGGAHSGEVHGGLTLAGVGSIMLLSHIEVSKSAGDNFEIRGGNFVGDHFVSNDAGDDDFYFTEGWQGEVQYGVVLRDPSNANSSDEANAIYAENDALGTNNSPVTNGVLSNFTIVGPLETSTTSIEPEFGAGILLERNAQLGIFNSSVMGWPTGIEINDTPTQNAAMSEDLDVKRLFLSGNTVDVAGDGGFDADMWFDQISFLNARYTTNAELMLTNAYNLTAPDFTPMGGSPLLGAAEFASFPELASFEDVGFVAGLSRTEDWTICWTNWDPQNTPYDEAFSGVAPVTAAFAWEAVDPGNTFEVQFTDLSSAATSVFWNFGDPSTDDDTSSLRNPTWTYADSGFFEPRFKAIGACGDADSVNTNLNIGLFADTWENLEDIDLYPNPASNWIYVDMNLAVAEEISFEIFDFQGRMIKVITAGIWMPGQGRYSIPVQDLYEGNYLIRVRGEKASYATQISVIR
jgi:hypothetical protein